MSRSEQTAGQDDAVAPLVFNGVDDTSEITVLVVDDEPDLLDLTATFLQREREVFDVVAEGEVGEALGVLDEFDIDAIVCDYDMPTMNGLEFLEAVRTDHGDLPFILFTGKGSEEIASEAISKGVTDYLQKKTGTSQYSILANRIINAVEQHTANKQLRRSQEKFSKLVTNSSDVIAIVDENGQFDYISPACERALGYTQEELIGKSAFQFMPPDDRMSAMEAFFEALENPEHEPIIEFRFEKPDGDGWTVVEARGNNLFDDDFINGFVVSARDITNLKRRQQELTQQNEQLKNMRKVITHDLRNPLNVATNALVLYRDTGDNEYLEKVDRAIARIDRLIEQVSALATNDTRITKTGQVSLKSVARDAWEMVDTGDSELHVYDASELEADPDRFQQLLENLFNNAVVHNDGNVTVSITTTDDSIRIEDDGVGIPEEVRERVFESGFSTDPEHTGFGLNIVKQIALGHGWDVDVTDGQRGGACIELSGVSFEPSVYN